MQFSRVVYKPHRDRKTENMVRLAQHAHRLRFDSIWVTDPIVLATKMTSPGGDLVHEAFQPVLAQIA